MNLSVMAQFEQVLHDLLVKNCLNFDMDLMDGLSETLDCLKNQNYGECTKLWKNVFQKDIKDFESMEDLNNAVKLEFEQSSVERKWEMVGLAVCNLQHFVEINFCGLLIDEPSESKTWMVKELQLDGEDLYPVIKNLHCFLIAKVLFDQNFSQSSFFKWWKFRILCVHQHLLTEKSEILYNSVSKIVEEMDLDKFTTNAKIQFHLEVAAFFRHFFDISRIKKHVNKATELAEMSVTETGLLGKRTKWQEKAVAQLTLDIQVQTEDELIDNEINSDLPQDLKLDDEVRLDKIAFTVQPEERILTATKSAVILSEFFLLKKSQPQDSILSEELMPYLNAVLSNKFTNWCLKSIALLERTKLEKDNKRSIERALMQIQTLVDKFYFQPKKHSRMEMVYATQPPPFWVLETELVNILVSVGSTKTALDIALKLQLWDEVITCYHLLELRHKAAEVIKDQIAKDGESATLLCMLGDATDDPDHYQKAIEISNSRSARAFRSVGTYYFNRKDYEKAEENYCKSLALNSFQLKILLRHGFSAMQIKAWDRAAKSYRSYCSYESDNFEAWNNLANAYINQGQKARAWKVLQEAVKCDYDNWKVWDNILVVSTDCAHYEELIRAYHRLLDLKNGKHVDAEVLDILVQAIEQNLPDAYDRPSRSFRKSALSFFGRLSAENGSEYRIWQLYSRLILAGENSEVNEEDFFKAAQMMQKSTASFMQKEKDWHKSTKEAINGLELARKYAERCIEASKVTTNPSQNVQQMSSAKMTIKSMISRVKQSHEETLEDENSDIAKEFQFVNQSLESLVNQIALLK